MKKEGKKMNGYTGKILRINLTDRKISTIDTKQYEQWVGGHGIGSAIFWDLVKDKAISGFDVKNVITIMTSPLCGTLAPSASSRTEVQGIGVQSYPIEWFTRGNFGGRFGPMLKFAGLDGIVIEGKADKPVYIDIRNQDVKIKDANSLWGLDSWQTQHEIWKEVMGSKFSNWMELGKAENGRRTTQKPAVLTIGPAGENLSRTACLIHDAGNAVGQGGFGGVWGSKNLKAISVIGTGSIQIADPNALIESRIWAYKKYGCHVDHQSGLHDPHLFIFWDRPQQARLQSCIGCHEGCRNRYGKGIGNESQCVETLFYSVFDREKHRGRQTDAAFIATDLLQKYGINAYEAWRGLQYMIELNKMGILGPGMQIDCNLSFDQLGKTEFAEKYLRLIAYREGIGDDFAEGFLRAAKKWGRLEEDLSTGILNYSYWGLPDHGYDPRAEVSWGYSSILGDRDCNEHDFNFLYWWPSKKIWNDESPEYPADWITKIIAEKLVPYEGDQRMLDYSTDNLYSQHMVKLVAWYRHYTRFWKQSVLYCDYRWPDLVNKKTSDGRGLTGEGEPRFLNAVTGRKYSFLDGMEIGRKIWNLDNAIWTLQGRHRDIVHFADYIYKVPFKARFPYYLPGIKDGKWDYINVGNRHLDRDKFEEFKTKYYKFEGWDHHTGWPKRDTLESLGLNHVAEVLWKDADPGIAEVGARERLD